MRVDLMRQALDLNNAAANPSLGGELNLTFPIPGIPTPLSDTLRDGQFIRATDSGSTWEPSLTPRLEGPQARPSNPIVGEEKRLELVSSTGLTGEALETAPPVAPAPFGLGLIADVSPFDLAVLDAAVDRFLERIDELDAHQYASLELLSSTFVVLFAAFGLERVWRRRRRDSSAVSGRPGADAEGYFSPDGFREWPGSWSASTP